MLLVSAAVRQATEEEEGFIGTRAKGDKEGSVATMAGVAVAMRITSHGGDSRQGWRVHSQMVATLWVARHRSLGKDWRRRIAV